LTELADSLTDRVRIYLRGSVSLLGEESLQRAINGRANVVFEGEYDAPKDLPLIYSKVHFNWCADFSGGENSLWLLPNRLYEGGYFGLPAIAIADHETGRVVRERGLGMTLEPPFASCLKDMLSEMTIEQYRQLRQRIEAMPASYFVDTGDMAEMMRGTGCNHGGRCPSQTDDNP
jgi:succinoglycan biosynthesis protein ExoL